MKTFIATIATGMMLTMSSIAVAAPIEFSGDVSVKYEVDTAVDTPTESGIIGTLTLKGEKKIGKGLSLYARLGAQYAGNPGLGNYDLNLYGQDTKAVLGVDQFGIIYKINNLTFKLGRQDIVLGVTELLYKRSEENVGNNAFVDGLSVTGTIGVIDLTAIIAKENNLWLSNNSFYAIRTGYNLLKHANVGVTVAQYQYFNAETSNHWGVDGTVTFGKSTLTAEYTQSNNSDANKAYAVLWNYKFNDKTALSITNFRVETNGDMGTQGEYDKNNRGFYYTLTHSFSDKLSLELVYKDQYTLADNAKNSKLEVKLTNTF